MRRERARRSVTLWTKRVGGQKILTLFMDGPLDLDKLWNILKSVLLLNCYFSSFLPFFFFICLLSPFFHFHSLTLKLYKKKISDFSRSSRIKILLFQVIKGVLYKKVYLVKPCYNIPLTNQKSVIIKGLLYPNFHMLTPKNLV